MKVNKYVLNSCITALILAIGLVIFFIVLKVGGNKKSNNSVDDKKPTTSEQITISFDSDGGSSVNDIKIKKGESIKLPTSTKEGYELIGWYLDDSKITNNTKFIKDTKLKAKWLKTKEDKKTFKITFNSKGGTDVSSMTVDCDTELSLPAAPSKEGYNFISWVDKNDTPILDGALLACSDITLYANWEKIPEKIEVIFYLDDAYTSEYSKVLVECGDSANGLRLPQNNPTKEGYEFVAWVDQHGKSILEGTVFTCDGPVKLSPYWNKKEEPKQPDEDKEKEPEKDEDKKKDNN